MPCYKVIANASPPAAKVDEEKWEELGIVSAKSIVSLCSSLEEKFGTVEKIEYDYNEGCHILTIDDEAALKIELQEFTSLTELYSKYEALPKK